jgi:hypothetical protein
MLRAEGHPALCAYHARPRARRSQSEDDVYARELLDGVDDFSSVFDINVFLGNIAVQLARKRIPRTDALALAYLGQLMLNSNRAMDRELDARRNVDGFIIDFRGLKLRKPYDYDPDEDRAAKPPSS